MQVYVFGNAFLIDVRQMIRKPARRLDQPHSQTSPWWFSNGFLIDESDDSQDIDGIVDTLRYFDRLCQVVVIDIVRRKSRKNVLRISLRPRMKMAV